MDIYTIDDYRRELQSEANKDAYKVTCQFFTKENNVVIPHASGVFIKVEDFYFLFTAAHVTDDYHHNDIFIRIDNKTSRKLGGKWTVNDPKDKRETDRIDTAVLKLDEISIEKVKATYEFLDISEVGINHNFELMSEYQLVGFPASQSKYNKSKNEIKSKSFLFTTMPAEKAIYEELKCEDFTNFIVKYHKKKVEDYKTGKLQTGPDLYGISGSGLWYTPEQLRKKGERVEKKLVGIMTEWSTENRKYLIGTRIDLFTECIREKYNLNIEQSKLGELYTLNCHIINKNKE